MTEFSEGRFHRRKFLRFLEEPTIQERNEYVWQGRPARTDGPDSRSLLSIRRRAFVFNLAHHLRDLSRIAFNHNASSVRSLDMGCCHRAISIYSIARIVMHIGICIQARPIGVSEDGPPGWALGAWTSLKSSDFKTLDGSRLRSNTSKQPRRSTRYGSAAAADTAERHSESRLIGVKCSRVVLHSRDRCAGRCPTATPRLSSPTSPPPGTVLSRRVC